MILSVVREELQGESKIQATDFDVLNTIFSKEITKKYAKRAGKIMNTQRSQDLKAVLSKANTILSISSSSTSSNKRPASTTAEADLRYLLIEKRLINL